LAAKQGGAIANRQLTRLGVSGSTIKSWLRSGRLHPRHRGVYALGHPTLAHIGILWAAVLACGPGAVLSHRSAALLWCIRQSSRKPVDVTVVGRSRRRRKGIDVHLVRHLDPRDVTEIGGLPVTTLARTLLDLAEVVPVNQLRRAINEADYLKLFDLKAIDEQLSRSNGRRGQKPLTAVLSAVVPDDRTRSDLEEAFLTFCEERGIPRPRVNRGRNGKELDMTWLGHDLIVELDGYQGHRTRRAFENDRRRDARHLLEGLRTVRVTANWLTTEPADLEATVKRLLVLTRRAGEDERK
jgi:predicted transcriptional regulator of viral defense system